MSVRRNVIGFGLLVAVLVAGGFAMLQSPRAAAQPAGGDSIQAMAQQKVEIAKRSLAYIDQLMTLGRAGGGDGLMMRARWVGRLADAQVQATNDPAAQVAAVQESVNELKRVHDGAKLLHSNGVGGMSTLGVDEIEFELLDAQIKLAQLRAR